MGKVTRVMMVETVGDQGNEDDQGWRSWIRTWIMR
jgi:hypothetical protein